ncbi:hypothetical protein SteCoe_38240 [Stentor coeruleus]|uniref:MORN repeat protein n=1 Tax=Stentor coeruleus TaxID=5963 RepID=A0A1R2ALL1_9CILI|nr:hypothetical protein SteCoe_38240 [Stentor coeruleus]
MGCSEAKPECSYLFEKQDKTRYKVLYFNGDSYLGGIIKAKKSGIGELTTNNGETYNGEWKKDRMSGKGTYVYKK